MAMCAASQLLVLCLIPELVEQETVQLLAFRLVGTKERHHNRTRHNAQRPAHQQPATRAALAQQSTAILCPHVDRNAPQPVHCASTLIALSLSVAAVVVWRERPVLLGTKTGPCQLAAYGPAGLHSTCQWRGAIRV